MPNRDKHLQRFRQCPHQRRLHCEQLEDRRLLAVDLSLLADIGPGANGSDPKNFLAVGDLTYFTAHDSVYGRDLFVTDGTTPGTRKITAYDYSDNNAVHTTGLANINDTVFFNTFTLGINYQLWRTNGTGTQLVGTFPPLGETLNNFHVVGDTLYFTALDYAHGRELWKVVGANGVPEMVREIKSGGDQFGNTNFGEFEVVGDTLYFVADDGVHGAELWRTDPVEGAVLVKDTNPGTTPGFISRLAAVGDTLYFRKSNDVWKSDGTTLGTVAITMNANHDARHLTAVGDDLYFFGRPNPTSFDTAIWKVNSDGLPEIVKNLGVVTAGSFADDTISPAVVGNLFYFTLGSAANGVELWKSDGTAAGTVMVSDIRPGTIGSDPRNLVAISGKLYFSANDAVNGRELWRTDGTVAGTELVANLLSGSANSDPIAYAGGAGQLYVAAVGNGTGREAWVERLGPRILNAPQVIKDINQFTNLQTAPGAEQSFYEYNGHLYFGADYGRDGVELWRSDGTAAGTTLVKDIRQSREESSVGIGGSRPHSFIEVGGVLYFIADDDVNVRRLWKTDGTAEGTIVVVDSNQGLGVTHLYGFENKLYFRLGHTTGNTSGGEQWWITDGTAEGTLLLEEPPSDRAIVVEEALYFVRDQKLWLLEAGHETPILLHEGSIGSWTIVGSQLYFFVSGETATELWKTDGTVEGTTLVTQTTEFGGTANFNGRLIYSTNPRDLWISDGTEAGTFLLKEIRSDSDFAYIGDFTAVGSTLFFTANDGSSGRELWKTDGTPEGTVRVTDLNPGTDDGMGFVGSVAQYSLHSFAGQLYFSANDGERGVELWKTGGTGPGTVLVKDINQGEGSSYAHNYIAYASELYFSADDGEQGFALWKLDPTTDAVELVRDISPNVSRSAEIRHLSESSKLNGELYFTTQNQDAAGEGSWQLWKTNGSPQGTILVKEGLGPLHTAPLTVAGDYVYFVESRGGDYYLWRSNGTASGTIELDSFDFMHQVGAGIQEMVAFDGMLYFVANKEELGYELWRSDGTPEGTQLFNEFIGGNDPIYDDAGYFVSELAVIGSNLYFAAVQDDSILPNWDDISLWKTDGTLQGTLIISNIDNVGARAPTNLMNVGGTLYFNESIISENGGSLTEGRLWKSDGTFFGTMPTGIDINGDDSFEVDFYTSSGMIYVDTRGESYDGELWISDGTSEGTFEILDYQGEPGGIPFQRTRFANSFAEFDEVVYFLIGGNTGTGSELWTSEGTQASTIKLLDLPEGVYGYNTELIVKGDLLFIESEFDVWVCDADGNVISLGMTGDQLTAYGQNILINSDLADYEEELAYLTKGASIITRAYETNFVVHQTGRLVAHDSQHTGGVNVEIVSVHADGNGNGITNAAWLSMLTLSSSAIVSAPARVGELGWTFDSGSETFDYLVPGETLKLNYVLRYTDNAGAFVEQRLIVEIIGADTPALPGDYDLDGDVDGRDFLAWQRGESPDPFSSEDLDDWQQVYGEGELAAVSAAVFAEDDLPIWDQETFINSIGLMVAQPRVGFTASSLGTRVQEKDDYVEQVDRLLEQFSSFTRPSQPVAALGMSFGDLVVRRGATQRFDAGKLGNTSKVW